MKKIILLVLLTGFIGVANGQIKKITVQASGLTCSMCSKAIYKAIAALSFVQEVTSDIKNSSYTIIPKNDQEFIFDAIKDAVTQAGFSVASLKATLVFDHTSIQNDTHIVFDNKTFHFMNVQPQTLEGEKIITFIDKGFVSTKEQKKYAKLTTLKCYETGIMASCCSVKSATSSNRVYHVTF